MQALPPRTDQAFYFAKGGADSYLSFVTTHDKCCCALRTRTLITKSARNPRRKSVGYSHSWSTQCKANLNGIDLLKFPQVDVISRDNSRRTILEHLIRHPNPHATRIEDLTIAFSNSSALNVNLETSSRHSPLDLIVSLFDTWLLELGNIDAEWESYNETLRSAEKISWFSKRLVETARLLLERKKADTAEQKRCVAQAPDTLRGLMLESIRQVEPRYYHIYTYFEWWKPKCQTCQIEWWRLKA